MLFEFHRQQNVKKPGSVHATYLVAGFKRKLESVVANDDEMKGIESEQFQSSPFQSSSMPPVQEVVDDNPVLSITLIGEEELDGMFKSL